MNNDENKIKSNMSKQASDTLEEKEKEVVAEAELTKEVTAHLLEARDKVKSENKSRDGLKHDHGGTAYHEGNKDAPNTGPELFPETVPPCFAMLGYEESVNREGSKDTPNTGPELFPETVPSCVAKLGYEEAVNREGNKDTPNAGPKLLPETVAPGASNPEAIPMTTVASATRDELKRNADHHVAKIKACFAKLGYGESVNREGNKDTPNTGPETFPATVPSCVAKLGYEEAVNHEGNKDTPNAGPKLLPETVAPGASNPEAIPMTTVASATTDERKRNADHHAAKIKASPKGGMLKMAPRDEHGPELWPETLKNPPFIAKSGSKKSFRNDGDMVNAKAGPALRKVNFDIDKSNPNKKTFVETCAAASIKKDGMDATQGMPVRRSSLVATGMTNLSSHQTDDHQSTDVDLLICDNVHEKRQAIVERQAIMESNRRSRERRKMSRENTSNKEEDLKDEGLPSSIPSRVGDKGGAHFVPRTLLPGQYDEMKVEEEEILSQADEDVSQAQPGAFAVAGIGALDPSYAWQSTSEIIEIQDLNENNNNKDNDQAHLSNEDTIPMSDQQVSNRSEHLISAIVVDDGAIPEAEAVSEDALDQNKRRRAIYCIVALNLIIATIALAAVLTRNKTTSGITQAPSQSTELPSQNPTSIPSTSPSMSPTTTVRLFLEKESPLSIEAFEDETSPQFKALEWLEYNHKNLVNTYDDHRIIQRFVLATLYYSTEGEQQSHSNGWLDSTQPECSWFLYDQNTYNPCSDDDMYEELKLTSNQLQGTLPQEIYLLSNLRVLDLSDNMLSGSIPSELGLLKHIKTINLNSNGFDGSLPTELCNLKTSLTQIDLTSNNIEGKIPSALGLLTGLESLKFGDNTLSGTIISEIGMLSDLKTLSLAGNNIDGIVPLEVASLQNLEVLDLNDNILSGTLPLTMNETSTQPLEPILPILKELRARTNLITGTLPSDLGLMSNLEVLDLNSNRLEGSIPSEMGQLDRLDTLDLSKNSGVSGILPTELRLLTRLESMQISNTRISGSLGTEISGMKNLKLIDLSYNDLSGKIPETLRSLENLESLDLSDNGLSGKIPETLGSLENLESLDLSRNKLSDTIPETIKSLVNLELLDLSRNKLSGKIPETIGSLESLEILDLRHNNLSGKIPDSLGSLVNLESLNLVFNGLSGTIPETIGSLVKLESLDISVNDLSGTVPTTLGSLVKLDNFGVGWNNMTGEISMELCEVKRANNIESFLIGCEISCDCCFEFCRNPPRIASSSSSTQNCPDGMTLLQVATGTDRDPEGVEWDVVDESTNETLLQEGPLTPDDLFNTTLKETCVPSDVCLVFTIRGSNDDGSWAGAGDRFMVHLNGSEVSNGRFQDFQKDEGFFLTETSSCAATDRLQACSVTHHTCDSTGPECDLDNAGGLSGFCIRPVSPSLSPSLSTAPSLSPSSNPTYTPCDDGLSTFRIEMMTDDFPREKSWKLVDDATGNVILQDGNYTDAHRTIVNQTCIANDACLRFTINNTNGVGLFHGGGYVIYVNNEPVVSGEGNSGSLETKLIGSCPETSFPSVLPSSSSLPTASPTTPTEIPSTHPTPIAEDKESLSPSCQDGMVNFTVEIAIENDPERVSWTVMNRNSVPVPSGDVSSNDASVILQGGPYNENDIMYGSEEGKAVTTTSKFVESTCVISDACLVFEIQDAEATAVANNNELLYTSSADVESVLATVNLYANDIKIAVETFLGPTAITEVGACSPVQ